MLPTSTSSSSLSSSRNNNHHRISSPSRTSSLPAKKPSVIKHILLAEFDIDEGSKLTHQYPEAIGADEHLLAEHMLPDGAHDRTDDWTVFYLNQIPPLTVKPLDKGKGREEGVADSTASEDEEGGLLYVMSLVRTKKVASVRRGALVKALAVATHNPYIQIYKPVLLLALEEYYENPVLETLERLFNSINSMDLSTLPILSPSEKLILRPSERTDLFLEKFATGTVGTSATPILRSKTSLPNLGNSVPSRTSSALDGAIEGSRAITGSLNTGEDEEHLEVDWSSHKSASSGGSLASLTSREASPAGPTTRNSSTDDFGAYRGSSRSRASTMNSVATGKTQESVPDLPTKDRGRSSLLGSAAAGSGAIPSPGKGPKDTHWYETRITFNDVGLPIRIPLATFPDEIGDYSLIKLLQTFSPTSTSSSSTPLVTGPSHPHLHTSGPSTHPIVLLFNALVTHKRVIILGHGQPAGHVASLVLAACALGSGCGTVLGGFTERAFPYTNLSNLGNLENVPGFIAGVCNPAFLIRPSWWDVLCNIETGKIIVSKDIAQPAPITKVYNANSTAAKSSVGLTLLGERGGEKEEEEVAGSTTAAMAAKTDSKLDNPDTIFMDEITAAVAAHYAEGVIRARFTDYVLRFVRLASRYEEEVLGLTPSIGFPTQAFNLKDLSLGSGYVAEEGLQKEIQSNAGRIEGWRTTPSYFMYQQTFMDHRQRSPIGDFDLSHQLSRLRQARRLPPAEVEAITRTLALHARSDEGVVAILAHLPPHFGGLLPISFGLFHPTEVIRQHTLELMDLLNMHPTGSKFIATLNAFHRTAYIRLTEARRAFKASHYARTKESGGASTNGSIMS